MSLATFAYVVSALEFLAAVSLMASPGKTAEWFARLREDDVILRVVGALFFVLSFLALTERLSIGFDVEGLIRLTAWIGAVKSLLLCWWPRRMMGRMDWFLSAPARTRLLGLIALAAAVVFLLAGDYLQGRGV
jgi:hypothetical protein